MQTYVPRKELQNVVRRGTMALAGIVIIGVTAFFFLVPVSQSELIFGHSSIVSGSLVDTTYHSLGCMYRGIGDAYFIPGPSFSLCSPKWAPMLHGLVFSCAGGPWLGW